MMNLENSSEKPLRKEIPKWLIYSFIITSFIGFLDATYLTAEHYSQSGLNCVLFEGCDKVANSTYSVMFGLPVALYGATYYLFVLFLSLLYVDTKHKYIGKIIPPLTLIGFIFSVRFVYLQISVIQAICTYCMFSALTSTILFALGAVLFRHRKKYL